MTQIITFFASLILVFIILIVIAVLLMFLKKLFSLRDLDHDKDINMKF